MRTIEGRYVVPERERREISLIGLGMMLIGLVLMVGICKLLWLVFG
jgi:hypothetical protein